MNATPSRQQFGRLPYDLVDRGAMIHLGAGEIRIYLAILIGANTANTTHTSLATLASRAGCSTRTARRIVPKLASKGFISVVHGGGRGRANTYTINENPDTLSVPLLEPKTRTPKASPFSSDKPGHIDTERGTFQS